METKTGGSWDTGSPFAPRRPWGGLAVHPGGPGPGQAKGTGRAAPPAAPGTAPGRRLRRLPEAEGRVLPPPSREQRQPELKSPLWETLASRLPARSPRPRPKLPQPGVGGGWGAQRLGEGGGPAAQRWVRPAWPPATSAAQRWVISSSLPRGQTVGRGSASFASARPFRPASVSTREVRALSAPVGSLSRRGRKPWPGALTAGPPAPRLAPSATSALRRPCQRAQESGPEASWAGQGFPRAPPGCK